MTLIEGLIAETIVSGSLTIALRQADTRAQTRAALMDWDLDGKPTPVLDGILEAHEGTPEGRKETLLCHTVVSVVRSIVNRRAFEYLVHGIINQNSRLRERFSSLQKLTKRGG